MILLKDLSDPRMSQTTVLDVQPAKDLKFAKVLVSVLGDEEQQEKTMLALSSAAGYIRKLLGERTSMRSVPELHFKLDKSLERAARLSGIFRELKEKREKVDLPELLEALPSCENCLVLAHEHPEGDAIGSCLGWALALEEMEKKTFVYNADGVPDYLKFLPGADKVMTEIDDVSGFDTVFMLDCGAFDRGGEHITELLAAHSNVVNIDHHHTNERFGKLNIVLPEASSAGEIIYQILTEADHEISLPVATNLYTAILTDTGSFRNGAASPSAMRACADLLEVGVVPQEVAKFVYSTQPLRRQKLLGQALGTLAVEAGGKIATMTVTAKMLEETGATPDDMEGFVEEVRKVEGIQVAVLLREKDLEEQKASMRAKGAFDVSKIAAMNDGGGHPAAAGCTIRGYSLEEARQLLVDQITRELQD